MYLRGLPDDRRWPKIVVSLLFLAGLWKSWDYALPATIASSANVAPRVNSFNELCGPSSRCAATRRSLAHKFVGVQHGARTVGSVKICVDFQPTLGVCFLPMHFVDDYHSHQAGSPMSDIFTNMPSDLYPGGSTLLNFLPRAISYFTDINSKLPVKAAGTAVTCFNDTALDDFSRSDLTVMKRSGFPFLAHSFYRSEIGGDYLIIPDYHFSTAHGENFGKTLRHQAENYISLEKRKNRVFWRGTTTGPNVFCPNQTKCSPCDKCLSTPRVQLVRKALSIPRADIKFSKQTGFCENCDLSLQNQTVLGDRVPGLLWSGYRATLDLDGKADAWGSFVRYRSGSVVLRVDSEWRHWYDDRLQPWVHFIPVRRDLSDLSTQIAYATSEDPDIIARLKVIASNAEKALEDLSYEGEVSRVASELADNWKKARKWPG